MNNQVFIQKMIDLNKWIDTTDNKMERVALETYKNELENLYNQEFNKICHHDRFYHNDYFSKTELKECEKEKSGFRLVTCTTCHKQVWLVKNKNEHWDETIGNHQIIVTQKQKVKNYK